MEWLKDKRNRAVDDAIIADIKRTDPMSQVRDVSKEIRRQYDGGGNLERYVAVAFAAMVVGQESIAATFVPMLCETCQYKCVAVELSEASLTCVRLAAMTFVRSGGHDVPSKRRRIAEERITTGYTFVRVDYRRKAFWVSIVKEDGASCKKYKKPTTWDNASDRNDAIESLVETVRAEHHERNAEGEYVLASANALGVFADEVGEANTEPDDEGEDLHDEGHRGLGDGVDEL